MSKGKQRFWVEWSVEEYAKRRPEVAAWGLPAGRLVCVFTKMADAEAFALRCGGSCIQILRFRDVGPLLMEPVKASVWLTELREYVKVLGESSKPI